MTIRALITQVGRAPPLPVHVITPEGRLSVPKVRAFVDFAMPRLRRDFADLAGGAKCLRIAAHSIITDALDCKAHP